MDHNFTDFTKNDTFSTWTSSGDISSSTDRVVRAPRRRPGPGGLHKRPHYDYYGEPPAKRAAPSIRVGSGFKWNLQTLAGAADAVESGGKSPVSALNELGVRVAYSVLRQGGPAHCPSFHVAVTVADMRFEGWGHSKREARAAAARACLAALLARAGRVLPAPSPHQDFTSDEPHRFPVSEFQCLEPKVKVKPPPEPVPVCAPPPAPSNTDVTNGKDGPSPTTDSNSPVSSLFGAARSPASHKSPINVLYENYSGLVFNCTFGDGSPLTETQAPLQLSHSMRFKVVCQIKDTKFEGYGSSKKLAKLAAARSALAALEEGRARDDAPAAAPHAALHQTLADHIGKLVNEKFNELMKNDLVHSKRKVLAGIVITTHNRIDDARVIAVTTGTKCVSGEHMSVSGRAVNDCHAEVAARRCLQRHLYAQLLMYANQPDPSRTIEESDLEPLPGGGFQLKPSRQVHLYVSTAPCGDGRIFSPHEHHHTEPDKHPNRLARGQLRTKIESGEGTIPVKNCNNVLQTWDGVMQGERLLTMSCSDKVARWCVCGLQGALLSRLLRPVYLQSLVLGSLLHPHHMYRAICGRIEAYISSLPPPFHLQRPLLSRAASTEARTPARAPSFSVCWCCTQQLPEVINATTGKLESGQPSLLCKQSMFARWQYLVRRLPLLPQDVEPDTVVPEMPEKPDTLLYNEAKQMCPTYQLAKQRLIDAFEKAKLGSWIKRPLEQDQFVCEITDAEPSLLFAWAGPHPAACGEARRTRAAGTAAQRERDDKNECRARTGTDSRHSQASDRVSALRQPMSLQRRAVSDSVDSGYDRVDSHNSGSTSVANNGNHGIVGTRSLAYFNYRNNKTGGVCLNNKIKLPKSNNSSISSRLILPRANENNVVNKRSVPDLNNVSFSVDDDNYWEGFNIGDSCNDRERSVNDDEWDDDIHSKQLAQECVKSTLLLRRLHIYEKICTKNK